MIKVVRGEDKTVRIKFRTPDGYLDFTGMSEITARFNSRSPGSPVTKTYTSSGGITLVDDEDVNGNAFKWVQIVLTDTNTQALRNGKCSAEILIDYGSTRKIFQLEDEFTVVGKIFP